MARKRDEDLDTGERSYEPGPEMTDPNLEHDIPPEAPGDLDPSETPIVADSPRRALSARRFGNPRKEEMAAQPPNSDSVTDDDPMEPSEEADRDTELEDGAVPPRDA